VLPGVPPEVEALGATWTLEDGEMGGTVLEGGSVASVPGEPTEPPLPPREVEGDAISYPVVAAEAATGAARHARKPRRYPYFEVIGFLLKSR
jgi:hypothetical protein